MENDNTDRQAYARERHQKQIGEEVGKHGVEVVLDAMSVISRHTDGKVKEIYDELTDKGLVMDVPTLGMEQFSVYLMAYIDNKENWDRVLARWQVIDGE